jgi:undecaprenyl-diphosphatase
VLRAITQLGGTPVLLAVMVAVGLLSARRKGWGVVGYLAVVGIGVTALNNLLKLIVHRSRPDLLQLSSHAGSSFPSGHSAAASACWAAIAVVLFGRWVRPVRALAATVAVFVAIAVATSRVLLGVHWLTDVIAGLALGWSWFLLCTVVFGGPWLRFGAPAKRVPVASTA